MVKPEEEMLGYYPQYHEEKRFDRTRCNKFVQLKINFQPFNKSFTFFFLQIDIFCNFWGRGPGHVRLRKHLLKSTKWE